MASVNLDSLLEKRREATGSAHCFPVEFSGKTFHFVAPEIASTEWNDRHSALREDSVEGLISQEDLRREMTDLVLGDEAESFIEAANKEDIDPLVLIAWAMEDHADYVGKTRSRQNSNRSQRRAKQR